MKELKQSIDKLIKITVSASIILITFLGGLAVIILPDDKNGLILLWLSFMLIISVIVYRKIQ